MYILHGSIEFLLSVRAGVTLKGLLCYNFHQTKITTNVYIKYALSGFISDDS